MSSFASTSSLPKRGKDKFALHVYWQLIGCVLAFYVYKTLVQTPIWKNDAVLFTEASKTCPRSAKLQLQMAKLRLNNAEYAAAEKYIDRAEKIDPDFCDVGYQKALLQLMYKHDVQGAMKTAAGNLQCVYTNMQSWELLNKIWEQQLSEFPGNYAILNMHGDLAAGAKMYAFAAKKYHAASSAALEAKNNRAALEMIDKAEHMIPLYEIDAKDTDAPVESSRAMVDLTCFIRMFGGTIRLHILKQQKQQEEAEEEKKRSKKSTGKKAKEKRTTSSSKLQLETKAESMLLEAMHPRCVILDPENENRIVSNNAILAAGPLSELLQPKAMLSKEERNGTAPIISYARYLGTARRLYQHIANHGGVPNVQGHAASDYLARIPEVTELAARLWHAAGQESYEEGAYKSAANSFKQCLLLLHADENAQYEEEEEEGVCEVLYLYAQSLAGQDNFLENAERPTSQVQKAISTLARLTRCISTSSQAQILREKAQSQLKQLRQYLETLRVGVSTNR